MGRDGLLAAYRKARGRAQNLETFVQDLRKKKPSAQEAVRAWGEWLTLAIRNLADLFNPQLVVLAGPLYVTDRAPGLIPTFKDTRWLPSAGLSERAAY